MMNMWDHFVDFISGLYLHVGLSECEIDATQKNGEESE